VREIGGARPHENENDDVGIMSSSSDDDDNDESSEELPEKVDAKQTEATVQGQEEHFFPLITLELHVCSPIRSICAE
jgi:hypothetical protein